MFARNWYLLLAGALIVSIALISCSKKGSDDDVDDGNNPYMILDLQAVSVSDTSVTLTWTATGDDADVGTCTTYDMRYYRTWINHDNWEDAIQVTGEPSPKLAGSADSMEVVGLDEDSSYYFALMAKDEAGNDGGISNCVMAMCIVDHEVSFPDANLEAAIRENVHKPTGQLLQSDLTGLGIS